MHQMNLHYPSLVLVPHTSLPEDDDDSSSSSSLLVQCIKDEFVGVPIEPVQRKYWNDMAGMRRAVQGAYTFNIRVGLEFIQQLALENDERAGTLLSASNKSVFLCWIFQTTHLNVSQVLRIVCYLCSPQIRRIQAEPTICCYIPSDPLHVCRGDHDDRRSQC
jgi:hypothetical protein